MVMAAASEVAWHSHNERIGSVVTMVAEVTAVVIMYFTSFPHSIAAFALLKPLLPDFVLPVIRHTLSIPYFFFSENMIVLAYIWFAVRSLFHSITVSSVNVPLWYSLRG